MLSGFFLSLFGADSRSRGARAPWFERSIDIVCFAVSSSAQTVFVRFPLLAHLVSHRRRRSYCTNKLFVFCAFIRTYNLLLTFLYFPL